MPSSNAACAQCGSALDSTALGGLCPRCVALDFLAPAPGSGLEAETTLLEDDERRLGDYELLEEIARGGMGVVYRARQLSLGREVAVKMILHGVLAGDMAIARFKAEAAAAAGLSHPNIVAIHEIGEHRGRHFFSMEFVAGRTLAEWVRDGPLPAKVAAGYLERVAAAVHYAHERGVLHRDLKPSNILVDGEGRPRVTDFGLAKRFDSQSDLTLTGQVLGTPAYISPEQAGGAKFGVVDARSDVYSLGAVLYHALCGLVPFSGESVPEILHKVTDLEPVAPRLLNPSLPRDLETICLKCLAKESSRRYGNALALAEDLGRFLRGEPILARPVGRVEKIWRWSRRQPALAAALVGCVVILVGGVSGILWQLRQTKAAQAVAVQKAKDEETQRKAAQQSELVMRQNLYAADMLEVQRAVEQKSFTTARSLLDAHRPKAAQPDLRGFEWRHLWERSRGDDAIVLTDGDREARGLAFSPDGRWLAASGTHTTIWDTTSWQVRAQAEIHNATSLAFYPNSASLVVSIWGPWSTRRWDWQQSGDSREFINYSDGSWPYVAVSPKGDLVASGYAAGPNAAEPTGSTMLYDAVTGGVRLALPESGGRVAFSPDGQLLATGTWKDVIKLWNPATGGLVRELTHANGVTEMTFSPDTRTLAVCTPLTDGTWFYDVATGARRPFARGNYCCAWGAAFSPDGATFATAVTDGTVRLWDMKSGSQTACFLSNHGALGHVAWSPDGKILASAGGDGTVQIWNPAAAKKVEAPVTFLAGEVKRRLFSRDGKRVAVTEPDGVVSLRQWPSLHLIGTPKQIGQPLGFLPDGTAFLSLQWPAKTDGVEVTWWTVPDFGFLKRTALSQGLSRKTVRQLSPDGHLLVTGGVGNELRVFDLADNGRLSASAMESKQDDGVASVLAFSPDSRLLAAGFVRSTPVYLWDMTPAHDLFALKGHIGPVMGLAFSLDGAALLSGGGNIKSWEVAGRKELAAFPSEAYLSTAAGLDLSPDGMTLAIASDRQVRLWNVVTRREVARFETTATVSWVSFAPGGDALLITEQSTNGPVTLIERAPSFEQTDLRP
jgi:WD40 repeat protein/predicted Ser/Thr protein kinase